MGALRSSVEVLPMAKGLYLFSVQSDAGRRMGGDPRTVLPAFKVEPGPGTPPDDVEVISGPGTEGVWLRGRRDQIILKVKVSSVNVLLTSLSRADTIPLEIEIKRIDAPIFSNPIAQQPQPAPSAAPGMQPRLDGEFDDPASNAPSRVVIGPDTPLEHPAWGGARDRILAAAAGGPATLALLGGPGTGKTWLLRDLALTLRQRGIGVTLVRQGEAPFEFGNGAVVLVDEASRMSPDRLASVANQRTGLVVLADLPAFSSRLNALPRPPAVIDLAPLKAGEVDRFVTQWLERSVGLRVQVHESAVARLIAHSGGVPGLMTQILRRALTIADAAAQPSIDGGDIDEVARSRPHALAAPAALTASDMAPAQLPPALPPAALPPAAPPPAALPPAAAGIPAFAADFPSNLESNRVEPPVAEPAAGAAPAPRRRFWAARAGFATVAVAALAALIGVVAAFSGITRQRADNTQAVASAPAPMQGSGRADRSPLSSPDMDAPPRIPILPTSVTLPTLAIQPMAAIQPMTAVAPVPGPTVLPGPEQAAPAAEGAPGLMLVAQAGDTMRTLYARIYRGLRPPPFAEVAAANPAPIGPGAVVVFPAPPGGWVRR